VACHTWCISRLLPQLQPGGLCSLSPRLSAGPGAKRSGSLGLLADGTWLFWVLLAPLEELDNANRADDTSGMALVGLIGWCCWPVT